MEMNDHKVTTVRIHTDEIKDFIRMTRDYFMARKKTFNEAVAIMTLAVRDLQEVGGVIMASENFEEIKQAEADHKKNCPACKAAEEALQPKETTPVKEWPK